MSLGYLAGSHIDTIYHRITKYSLYALIALAVLLATSIAWRLLLRRRSRATPTREQAAPLSQRRPSPSDAAITEPTASQPTEATEPLRDS